jgi:hypothetical protein
MLKVFLHPMVCLPCEMKFPQRVDVRKIEVKSMTNDASGFSYQDYLQVLNDNRLKEAQETIHAAIYHFDYRKTVSEWRSQSDCFEQLLNESVH